MGLHPFRVCVHPHGSDQVSFRVWDFPAGMCDHPNAQAGELLGRGLLRRGVRVIGPG